MKRKLQFSPKILLFSGKIDKKIWEGIGHWVIEKNYEFLKNLK